MRKFTSLLLLGFALGSFAQTPGGVREMMKVRNLGRKSLEEVKVKLADLGLGLKNDK